MPIIWTAPESAVCAELGITPRQVRYWEEGGAFIPDQGVHRHKGRSRHFTPAEVEQLRSLKPIIIDEQCPVAWAQEIMRCRMRCRKES